MTYKALPIGGAFFYFSASKRFRKIPYKPYSNNVDYTSRKSHPAIFGYIPLTYNANSMKQGVLWLFLLLCIRLQAQDISIDATYDNTTFGEVVKDLEDRYPLRFYYVSEWVDSLRISAKITDQPLQTGIATLLSETSLQFYLTSDNRVILTGEYAVDPRLGVGYFDGLVPPAKDEKASAMFARQSGPAAGVSSNTLETQLFPIGDPQKRFQGQTATFAGYLRNNLTGEPISGASVFTKDPVVGAISDAYGYFVLTLPKGEYEVFFTYVGMRETKRRIMLYSEGKLDVDMEDKIISLKEVEILSERSSVESVQTGVASLNIKEIKTIPTVLGEADLMKITLTLPGVQSVGEGASGFNVRGGNTDQNLVMIDDGVIYNPSHLFGFFSAFNPDAIQHADLYKSGIQAQYGGRVSSVFDVSTRDGNKKKLGLSGGIGPITSRITVEGPIKKNNSSFLLGVRSTYSDWILGLLDDPAINSSTAFFADGIAKIFHKIDDKNSVSATAYHSRDRFRLNSDTLFQYSNTNASVRFRHLFNNSFSGLVSVSYTDYAYQIGSEASPANAFDLDYRISQTSLKLDFDYFPQTRHHIRFGLHGIGFRLNPGEIAPAAIESVVANVSLNRESGLETALYIGDEVEISNRLSLYGGLRLSFYGQLGAGKVFEYLPNLPRETAFITDSSSYTSGQLIQAYGGPEYRFSSRYKLDDNLSVKMSYDKTRQYIHMLTNTVSISPTDTWRLSNPYIKPQIGDQLALGFYMNSPRNGMEFSVEGYYKILQNLLEYKDGADLLVNEFLETDVINAEGRSYGVELLMRKKSGKLNGWISYTYSRAMVRSKSPYASEQINNGEYFPSNFDKPHNLSIISNYKFSWRINTSLNFTYSTGRPTTLPLAQYPLAGGILPFFTNRNQYRIPDYMRVDLAINIEGNHKVNKLIHGSWSFSIYNLTGRNNAYSVFSRVENGRIQTYQLSVFSQAIPTITYNFRFQ